MQISRFILRSPLPDCGPSTRPNLNWSRQVQACWCCDKTSFEALLLSPKTSWWVSRWSIITTESTTWYSKGECSSDEICQTFRRWHEQCQKYYRILARKKKFEQVRMIESMNLCDAWSRRARIHKSIITPPTIVIISFWTATYEGYSDPHNHFLVRLVSCESLHTD